MKRVILSLIKFIDMLEAVQTIGKKQMEHRRVAHLVHQGLIKIGYTKAVV
jgi:hypothetical protein